MTKTEERNLKSRKGGFSSFITEHPTFISYCSSEFCCGYFGSRGRRKWKDQMLEERLIQLGLTVDQVVAWMTSTHGRHMMDDGDDLNNRLLFKNHMIEYTKDALEDTTVWAHPEHTGFYSATKMLKQRLYPWKYPATEPTSPNTSASATKNTNTCVGFRPMLL